jgi:hypothetical protein
MRRGISRPIAGGLCLLMAMVLSGTVAAPASALPEFVGPFPKPFTSGAKTSSLGVGAAGETLKCSSGSMTGEITGPSSGTATVKLNGCKGFGVPGGTAKCSNAGSEEVLTPALSATLGYIVAAKKQVGLDLAPSSGTFVTFVCVNPAGTLLAEVFGSVIGKITPVNKQVVPPSVFKLAFKFNKKTHVQEPTHFEGQPDDILTARIDGGAPEAAAFASSFALSFAASTKIQG